MNLQIRWKDCDRSKAVEAGINDILASLTKYNFITDDAKVEIVHYAKTGIFKTRINVRVVGKNVIRAEATAPTVYGATNAALDKIEDQLRRAKTKLIKGR